MIHITHGFDFYPHSTLTRRYFRSHHLLGEVFNIYTRSSAAAHQLHIDDISIKEILNSVTDYKHIIVVQKRKDNDTNVTCNLCLFLLASLCRCCISKYLSGYRQLYFGKCLL
ncbi:hypothetical protein M8J77_024748 [Diaphorina citri]|nr:hypothetical protein M8J77_024748 [Diaphorina citri]